MTTTSTRFYSPVDMVATVTSLADNGYRQTDAVDNTVNKYIDAHVVGSIAMNATMAGDGVINIWGYAGIGGASPTIYSGGLDGSNATGAITWGTTPSTSSVEGFNQLVLVGTASTDDTDDSNDIEFGPFSVAQAFGGVLPESWGLVIENQTNAAFDATGTNNKITYVGIKFESV